MFNITRGNKVFFGYTASDALSVFKSLYSLGTQNKAHYIVTLSAYEGNATTALPMIENGWSGFLATEIAFPINGATFEPKKIGGMNISVFTDIQFPQFTVNFLETKNNDIINSLRKYREMIVSKDGTVNEPAKYAMRFSFALFDSDMGREVLHFQDELIVAMSMETLEGISAKDPTPAELQVIFNVLDPYI